ncbi:MAG: hypothetical protein R3185_03820 [Candidatus Thermoplasmatota archaeon]|nr:hypothetical protein [Candidatus Thermoplasmatota archaeon]
MVDPWIGFLNEEAKSCPSRSHELERSCFRREVLDRTASSFPFPLEVSFRAVVMDRCHLAGEDYLVLGPTPLSGEALDLLGGVLVPCPRELFPGSVVDVTCALADPDTYDLDLGVLAEACQLTAIVPLER